MFKKIKQLFCLHDFEIVNSRVMEKDGHYIFVRTKYRCKKCGKVVYS